MVKSVLDDQPSLRDRTRLRVRSDIAEHAMALFDTQGFDETTVDEIAAAVGISPRSFFRYFATKEDVVMGDFFSYVHPVNAALRARPQDEDALISWRHALEKLVESTNTDIEGSLRTVRVMTSTASLRARHLEKHLAWAEILIPHMAERIPPGPFGQKIPARAIVMCGLECFDIALAAWAETNGQASLGDLLDAALAALSR